MVPSGAPEPQRAAGRMKTPAGQKFPLWKPAFVTCKRIKLIHILWKRRSCSEARKGKKIMMAISNGGVKSMTHLSFCKENDPWSIVFTYKLKLPGDLRDRQKQKHFHTSEWRRFSSMLSSSDKSWVWIGDWLAGCEIFAVLRLCGVNGRLCVQAAWFLTWSKLLAKWSHGGQASRKVTNESQCSPALPNQG